MYIKLSKGECISVFIASAVLRIRGRARYNLARSFYSLRVGGFIDGSETLIDVGAHVGLFARSYQACFPSAYMILVEPVERFRNQISGNLRKLGAFEILPFAAGSCESVEKINVSKLPAATSLLKISEKHEKLWPGSSSTVEEVIIVKKLDDLIDLSRGLSYFLKIDVQGFEAEALRGASSIIRQVKVCQIEVNFELLFVGEASLAEVIGIMTNYGFRLISVFDPIYGLRTRVPASVDLIFIKQR